MRWVRFANKLCDSEPPRKDVKCSDAETTTVRDPKERREDRRVGWMACGHTSTGRAVVVRCVVVTKSERGGSLRISQQLVRWLACADGDAAEQRVRTASVHHRSPLRANCCCRRKIESRSPRQANLLNSAQLVAQPNTRRLERLRCTTVFCTNYTYCIARGVSNIVTVK